MGTESINRRVLEAARSYGDWVTGLRRDFHRHPELSGQEERTASVVASTLKDIGLEEIRTGVGGTGVVGVIRGKGPGVVGLRADMDALPMDEENDVEYRSTVPGVMHACGHDAHTAMLLGSARLLMGLSRSGDLPGSVVLLFQPAEEDQGGALPMIEDGALDDPRPERVFAQHVWTGLSTGNIGISPGPTTASVDAADIRITATGGHAASPHLTPDPVVGACHVVTALQTVASRGVDPVDSAVVTVGSIHGGTKRNIIPPAVTLELTIRSASREGRERVQELILRIATGTAKAHGCGAEITYRHGYPAVINDQEATRLVRDMAADLLGQKSVHRTNLSMGGEDFSYFAEQVPGCMFRLGVSNPERGLVRPLHNPAFDLDEDALPLGSALLALAAWTHIAGRQEERA